MSTSTIPLLYKVTFFINTCLIQAQGQYEHRFANHDFPILMEILDKVMKANNLKCIQSNPKISNTEETSPKTIGCDKNNNLDTHGLPLIPDSTGTSPVNTKTNNLCQTEPSSLVPINESNSNLFAETIKRVETMFINALEKVTTQQSTLPQSSIEAMQSMYTQSLESQDKKFSLLLEKLESLTDKSIIVEKENTQMKGDLKQLKHTSALEKELIKSELESKYNLCERDSDSKSETTTKLDKLD